MRLWIAALKAALIRLIQGNGAALSAYITMALMLAIFPFTACVLSVASILSAHVEPAVIVNLIFGTWPDVVAEPILHEIDAVTRQSGRGTLTVGLILAILFASNGVEAIRLAVTQAYRDFDPRSIWVTRLLSLCFVLFGALLLTGVAVLQVGLPLYLSFVDGTTFSRLIGFLASDAVRDLITLAVLAFMVLACHLWLPGHRQPLREVLPGVVLTLALWIIAGYGFSFYLQNLSDYSLTYAGLAGVMATIVFLNLMAAIFILGAEFNGRLKKQSKS